MTTICPNCRTRNEAELGADRQAPGVVICKGCLRRYAVPAVLKPSQAGVGQPDQPLAKPSQGEAGRVEPSKPGAGSVLEGMARLLPDKALDEPGPPRPSDHVARRIGVMISKGGVGKTTTAVNLAAGLASAGEHVLLVDTDTQGQASFMLGVSAKAGLAELVAGDANLESVLVQARENLWLLPGGKSLAGVKRLIDRKDFGGELTLSETLGPLDSRFDFVVVDSAPGWDPLTVNVLFYVREVLVPLSLEVMSLQGLREFLKSLSAVMKYNGNIGLKYILPTFLDKRVRHPAEILARLEELYGQYLCRPIRYNAKLSEAPARGMTIFEHAPNSPGAQDYRELVRRIAEAGVSLRLASNG